MIYTQNVKIWSWRPTILSGLHTALTWSSGGLWKPGKGHLPNRPTQSWKDLKKKKKKSLYHANASGDAKLRLGLSRAKVWILYAGRKDLLVSHTVRTSTSSPQPLNAEVPHTWFQKHLKQFTKLTWQPSMPSPKRESMSQESNAFKLDLAFHDINMHPSPHAEYKRGPPPTNKINMGITTLYNQLQQTLHLVWYTLQQETSSGQLC